MTFVYRLLRGSWGIRIELTATARPHAGGGPGAVPVGDGVWLMPETSLGDPEVRALAEGLGLVAGEISASVDSRPVEVVIEAVRYTETDFQLEGLTAAMVGWAVARFGLRRRDVPVRFDRAANRYIFDL